MRAYWTGSLSFGLINIPIKILTATKDEGLGFEMVHAKDESPIHYKKVCEKGHEVSSDDIIKAFRTADGHLVTLTKDDFRRASVRKTTSMDLISFVSPDEIDVIYYERPFYLDVDETGAEAAHLLREAMLESETVGLVRYVFRNRENVGLLIPRDDGILLMQLRFQFQIKAQAASRKETKVPKRELTMALALIKKMQRGFKPKDYHDTYREDLERLIKAKAKGLEPEVEEEDEAIPTNVIDLMAMLKKSLGSRSDAAKPAHHGRPAHIKSFAEARSARKVKATTAAAVRRPAQKSKPKSKKAAARRPRAASK